MSKASPLHQSQVQASRTSDQPASIGVALSVGSINLLERLTELRGAPTYVYWFIIKDAAEDTDEEMCRARCGRKDAELPCPSWLCNPPGTSSC